MDELGWEWSTACHRQTQRSMEEMKRWNCVDVVVGGKCGGVELKQKVHVSKYGCVAPMANSTNVAIPLNVCECVCV